MSSFLFGGKNLFNSLPRWLFCTGRFEFKEQLQQDDLKEKYEFILFFKIILGKIASAARNLINSSPKQKRRPFPFLLSF